MLSSTSEKHGASANAGIAVLVHSLLPTLIQRRIPKLRTLRQALAQYSDTPCHSRASSESSVESVSPPPSYRASESNDEQQTFIRSPRSSVAYSRPSSSGNATPSPPYEEEPKSGVQWKYADPGFSLLALASQEEFALSGNPHFVRKQFLAGLTCVLRGLPLDLSEEERISIQEALPSGTGFAASREDQALAHLSREDRKVAITSKSRQSLLHRLVATVTLYAMLAISFILPYIQLLLKQAYQYDRRHQISDRVLVQGIVAADIIRRRTLTVATNICAMNEGKVGDAMKEVGAYVVQGFGGGVYEGLGEGLQLLGLRASISVQDTEGRQIKAKMVA